MKQTSLCSLLGLIGSTIANFFGGWDAALTTLLIFMGIIGLLAAMYSMILLPMLVTYKYDSKWYKNLGICLKNSAIIVGISPIQILFVTLLISAPMALCLIKSAALWVVVALGVYGIVFYTLTNIAYSQFYADNYIYFLYNRGQEEMKKQQAKEAKAYREQKAKQAKANNQSNTKRKR